MVKHVLRQAEDCRALRKSTGTQCKLWFFFEAVFSIVLQVNVTSKGLECLPWQLGAHSPVSTQPLYNSFATETKLEITKHALLIGEGTAKEPSLGNPGCLESITQQRGTSGVQMQ